MYFANRMKRMGGPALLLLLLSLPLASCAKPNAQPAAPVADGHDCATAIQVESVREEYVWIQQHHPGARLVRQSLTSCKEEGFPVDILEIRLSDGAVRPVYFNITKVMEGYKKLFGQ